MNLKLVFIILSGIALSACASSPLPSKPDGSNTQLAEASYSVSRAIVDLSETAQAARPMPDLEPPPNPASYGMDALTSVDWSGPIEPLVKQLASAANYRLSVLGTKPGIPVLVTLYKKNTMLADILRDAGYQCGRRATVVVFPESRVIELRYAKN